MLSTGIDRNRDAELETAVSDREGSAAAHGAPSRFPRGNTAANSDGRSRSASSERSISRRGSRAARPVASDRANGGVNSTSDVTSPTAGTQVLTGRLLDADTARPLRQVDARFTLQVGSRLQSRSTSTDEEGRFLLDGLAAGVYRLRTRVAGYQLDLRAVRVGAQEPVDIPLEPGVSIAGVVEDTEGRPVAGARVGWLRRDGLSSGSARRRTDAEGRFRISGLAAGSGLLDVGRRGFRSPFARRVELPRDSFVRIVLEEDRPLALLVVDEDDRGVTAATVVWKVADGLPGRTRPPGIPTRLTTGADGRVTLEGIPAESSARVTVSVEHPEYLRAERSWDIGELISMAGQDGDTRIVLESGARIAGVVLTADGTPAPRVRLTLTTKDLRRSLPAATDGRFTFRRLPPTARLALSADGGELGQAFVEGIDPSNPASSALRLVLRKEDGTLAGTILDAGEQPIVHAVVEAYTETRHFTAYSAADGRFRLEGLPGGEYGLRVRARGHGSALRRGVPTDTTDLRILLGAHGTLKGRASFSGPPRPFTVRMSPREPESGHKSGDILYRFTAKDLVFECPKVPAGEYDVTLERSGEIVTSTEAVTIRAGKSAGPIEFRDP